MLVEALRLHRLGHSVAIIDERPTLGGAWYTKDLDEWGNVEVGCHYIANNTETYTFLEDVLDLELEDMQPQPFIWMKGIEVSHKGFQNLPNNYLRIRSALRERTYTRLSKELITLGLTLADGLRREVLNRQKYRYPVAGCGVILQRLAALVAEHKIPVFLETEVNKIEINADKSGGICETNHDPIHFRHLVINSSTKLPDLRLGDQPIDVAQNLRIVQHMTVHVAGNKLRPFTYVGMYGGGIVNRVSDVGMYAPNAESMHTRNHLLLSVRVSSKSLQLSDADRAQAIVDRLISAGFITQNSQLLNYYIDQFDYTDTDDDRLKQLEQQLEPALVIRHSREFGDSLKAYTSTYTRATIGASA